MAEHDMASDSLLAGNIIRSVRILVVSKVFGAEAAAFAERRALTRRNVKFGRCYANSNARPATPFMTDSAILPVDS
jgi:hypothetical protein